MNIYYNIGQSFRKQYKQSQSKIHVETINVTVSLPYIYWTSFFCNIKNKKLTLRDAYMN